MAAVVCVGAAAAGSLVLLRDGDDPAAPRALTSDEVNRLAVTRFLNYQAGGRAVTINVPNVAGGLVITASVDYRTHTGYGVVRGTGRDASSDGLIRWTDTTVLVHPMADPPAVAPASPPASGWHSRPLLTSGMTLDSALAIVLDLGSDRPDNAALLPQNGATWVGQEHVHGHRTDIMTGPRAQAESGAGAESGPDVPESGPDVPGGDSGTGTSQTVRYWIGSDGTMHRVEVDIASAPEPVVLDFDTRTYVPVQPLPEATPTP
ncbi:hypothetical protein [Streptomyces johnsoniae]|uniref:DUF2092 domain-containing protein n=1 Tax=Streptomyces johnsoniae TaxID=3075532 RepID=A0ABU2SBB9_9ACTN|nr:hypothetical protein [Streptomyces sp. DSM 41886]MDT0445139.1 hypothetical protein [Streptomyces sp. DSM 41886]